MNQQQWTMISVKYARIPKETEYRVKINVDKVTSEPSKSGPKVGEEGLSRINKSSATMEEIIRQVHELLQEYPNAKLTLLQEPTRPKRFSRDRPRGCELDERTVEIIRTDLDAALEMFAPVDMTVDVRPQPPRIEIKE